MKTVTVCIGSSCHLKGSYDVIHGLQKLIKENNLDSIITLKSAFCLGKCANGVSVKINDSSVISVSRENINDFFNEYILNDKA
ncbi:(2Fe-2S) ferredoxin domain-containing protein [Clostridium sp.]|uniref:(2Fe-2S) ferredoxin domain-containing protein n=1 Tax=Clostridium sp. TaxID=1506 RepID=UPI003D6CB7F5